MNKDEQYMQRALQLAAQAGVNAAPNPMVGAVIVLNDQIIGEGYHEKCGEAHAEVNAVNSVLDKSLLKKATIYVTLEPCAHFGKTPPCSNLLVAHQFKKVIIATVDPFAKVAGKGIELLKNAGIDVEVGCLETEARELNKRFLTFHQNQRPYILLKWAQSPDGFIDGERNENETGEIRWISQPETQVLTHKWRTEEQAILVGWKTLLNDNPSLTARAFTGKNPLRVVIDPDLKAPKTATVFTDNLPTLVFNKQNTQKKGTVEWIQLDDLSPSSLMNQLFLRNITSVIIEGGRFTTQAFIDAKLWDEARVIVGQNNLNGGTEAPILSKTPSKNITFGKDSLYFYYNL
jgi:diaminohydroxyphosphoribosylaminopyrimidine deaminase / 5-amino-6-(5-phosphoribosylamino)uracil reductase